ncbi:MAG: polysulfide reductase NrfD, partial [Dehalococcoidia bacterium]|nr:polysulfide reductase NrfD [Dehalococcoidia bacterium]
WHVGGLPALIGRGEPRQRDQHEGNPGGKGEDRELRRRQQFRVLRLAMLVLLVVKAYYLWTDFSLALYTGSEEGYEAVRLVLFGDYGWAFWILQLGLGMVVPFIVLAIRSGRGPGVEDGLMGVLVLVGFAVARANIIFPALAVPELEGLTTAFHGPHLGFDYVPSLIEWSVTAGIVGLATLAFLLGIDRLRLFATESEVTTQ